MTIEETAEIFGKSTSTIRQITNKMFPDKKFSRPITVDDEMIEGLRQWYSPEARHIRYLRNRKSKIKVEKLIFIPQKKEVIKPMNTIEQALLESKVKSLVQQFGYHGAIKILFANPNKERG